MTRGALTLKRATGIAMVAVLGTWLVPAPSAQQPAPRTIDVTRLGPQVGQRIPDFSLRDQSGKTWTRQTTLGPKGAMVVFFRSADW